MFSWRILPILRKPSRQQQHCRAQRRKEAAPVDLLAAEPKRLRGVALKPQDHPRRRRRRVRDGGEVGIQPAQTNILNPQVVEMVMDI